MHNVRELIRPSKEEWASLPRRRSAFRQTLLAWLLGLLTVGGAFIADRGWEEVPLSWEESLLPVNVFGGMVTHTAMWLAIGGWAAGRLLALALSAVLTACALVHSAAGAASTPVWFVGAAIAVGLAATEFASSSRQLREIRRLAERLRAGETAEVGANALVAERKALTNGWWVTFVFGCGSLALWLWLALDWAEARRRGLPPEGETFGPIEAVFVTLAMMLLLWSCARNIRKWVVHRWAGRFVWIVPGTGGPVWASGLDPSCGGRVEPKDNKDSGCTCREEAARHDPGYEDFPDDDVDVDDYCALHGLDVLNSMDHDSFRAIARSAWLWDGSSLVPHSRDDLIAASNGLLGCAGYLFGGLPVTRSGSGMELLGPDTTEAHEMTSRDADMPFWAKSVAPADQGILDTIDLAPAGLSGTAVRYRHGRAWLRTDEP